MREIIAEEQNVAAIFGWSASGRIGAAEYEERGRSAHGALKSLEMWGS